MSFAAVAELESLVEQTLDATRAQLVLDLATASVADEAGIDIASATTTDALLDGDDATELVLPEWPVSAVTSVTVIGADGTEDLLRGPDDTSPEYRWSAAGILYRVGGCWPGRPRSVKVTWEHGYDPIPTGLKGVTLIVAARLLANPQSLRSLATGSGTALAFRDGALIELTETEKQLVRNALR